MHSFVLLALASSAFAVPILNAPVDVKAPIDTVAGVAANVYAPVEAAVGNVNGKNINVANGALSKNKVLSRGGDVNLPVDVKAPIKAATGVVANVAAPVAAAVGNANLKNVNVANDAVSKNNVLNGATKAIKRGGDVANLPIDVKAPIKAATGIVANVAAPVEAVAANVNLKDVNVANDAVSKNNVANGATKAVKRGGDVANLPVDVKAPIKAATGVVANVAAPVAAAVGNVNLKDVNVANGAVSKNNVLNGATKAVKRGGAGDIVNAPTKVIAPVKALVDGAIKVAAPVAAAAGNVNVKDANVANKAVSGNKVASRQAEGLAVPALPVLVGSTQANATKIVANIQSVLASTPAGSALAGPLQELNSLLAGATGQLNLLKGLPVAGVLDCQDGEVEASTQQAAETVSNLTKTVTSAVQQVTEKLGTDVPELKPVIALLNGSVNTLLSTVTGLVPGLTSLLGPLLTPLSGTLNSVGLGLGLGVVGL